MGKVDATLSTIAFLLVLALGWIGPAMAAPNAAPASLAPQKGEGAQSAAALAPTDTKQFGDWAVRCFAISSPAPCDMFELLTQRKTGKRVMSLSITYVPQSNRHLIQFIVPLGVSFSKGAVIAAGAYTSPKLFYRRCNKAGCYVEGFVDNGLIETLGKMDGGAKMQIASEGGRPLNIPFSLRGFADAHDAMVALERQKLSAPQKRPVVRPRA